VNRDDLAVQSEIAVTQKSVNGQAIVPVTK
jgi:hypothetical protein